MDYELSIITICKNERDTIQNTCESIISQQFKNFEWIVIDGESNDGTVGYLSNFKHIMTHFISEKDDGIYHAMNKGIELSSGKYVLFLNGGDYFFSENSLNFLKRIELWI